MSDFDGSIHIIRQPNATNSGCNDQPNGDDLINMDQMEDEMEDEENDDGNSSTMMHHSVHNNLDKPHYSVISNIDNIFVDRSGVITSSMLTITNNEQQ